MIRREHDWVWTFDDHSTVQIECLWRLLRDGRIVLTGKDHGHQFGMPSPINVANSCNIQLSGRAICSIELTQGTLDLTFTLDGSLVLQIIPDSSGYEAWNVHTPNGLIVAVGGGELTVFKTE